MVADIQELLFEGIAPGKYFIDFLILLGEFVFAPVGNLFSIEHIGQAIIHPRACMAINM